MAYVHVDVDLDEFDLSDLISECNYRLEKAKKTNNKKILDAFNELLVDKPKTNILIENVLDQMKYDHIVKVFSKYTLEQIETLLPL